MPNRDALLGLTPAESLVGLEEAVTVLSRKIDTISVTHQDPATLDQLESAIAALRGIVSHVASDDALAKLGEDVRVLGAKIDQVGAGVPGMCDDQVGDAPRRFLEPCH